MRSILKYLSIFINNRSRLLFLIGLILLLIPYIFWFILGENSYVLVHDNLDGEFVNIKKILDEGLMFNLSLNENVSGVMNGLPIFIYRSTFNITFLLFSILPAIYAYILNHLIVHLIGYAGMFLLLKKYLIKEKDWLVLFISLCFGFLSYYHIQFGISVSGQPILLFAFLNLLNNRQKWFDWMIIAGFPFYSFLVVTLPFYIPFLVIIGFVHYKKEREIPRMYILGIIILCLTNILVELPLIYSTFFNSDFVSHRVEWDKYKAFGLPSLKQSYDIFVKYFKITQYHGGAFDPRPILGAFLAGLVFLKFKLEKITGILFGCIVIIMIWVALNRLLIYFLYYDISIVRSFNTERFYLLLPFIWLLFLGIIIDRFNLKNHFLKLVAAVVMIVCLRSILVKNFEYKCNFKLLTNKTMKQPVFNQFYDVDLFNQIKEYLGADEIKEYNFLSIGIFPNIAQYNGLNTLDSYQGNYHLSYKHEFRKIIEKELDKNETIQKYFDYWGSRCYTFSSEVGKTSLIRKGSKRRIKKLDINTEQIKSMNGKYVLSSIPITNFEETGLEFLRSFEREGSYWELFLYEVE